MASPADLQGLLLTRWHPLFCCAQEIATELMSNEVNHVKLLRSALGSSAVAAPQLNVGSAFSEVLNAALGSPASPTFSPYTNDIFFLLAAFMFEVRPSRGCALDVSKLTGQRVCTILRAQAPHVASLDFKLLHC